MSIINTNVISLNAQRNLNTNSASLSTTIQRLTSGLRINSAKDDAAGLAISERFTTQIRGMDQAARNANDGISLAQTAEGALSEIGNNLQRIRELAVQSSNATNSSTDRVALQKEVGQLTAEIQRVSTQTDFNGSKLLDGSFAGQAFQVGANAGQLITVKEIANAQTSSLGGTMFATAEFTFDAPGTTAGTAPNEGYDQIDIGAFTLNGVNFSAMTVSASGVDDYTSQAAAETAGMLAASNKLTAAINAKSSETGVIASIDLTTPASPKVVLNSINAGKEGDFIDTNLAGGALVNDPLDAASPKEHVSTVDITSFAGAQKAIAIMDNALTEVNASRADLGAMQNRFTSVVANLNTISENLSASRSRIRDADFAKETAELSRTQILQQAGTAMLAQANQIPQGVLTLLR